MSAETSHSRAATGLQRNVLGLPEMIFQGVTHIAPATNVIFTFPIIALKAGPDMPISLLLATLVCFLIANTVSQFSIYLPSAGGYYSFATRGLGNRWGFMSTWSYLIYDILGPAGCLGFLGYLLSDTLQVQFHRNVPWWSLAIGAFVLVWALTHHGIQLSMRITAYLGAIEILIMLALAVTFLLKPGPGSNFKAPFMPSLAPGHFGGILAGMVFSILALSGFEGPAPLAQESRNPTRYVSLAVNLSLIAIGVFYVFTSYASAIGWGTGHMDSFASNANPYYVLGHKLWGAAWWIVVLAIANSAIGVGLACTNSASRVLYTMGSAGSLPARFARIHPTHRTPSFSIAFIQMSGIIAVLLVGLALKPEYIFGLLETVATLAVILIYGMANLALTSYMRREQQAHFSIWGHAVAPWMATIALLPVLFVTLYPLPAWPYSMAPYLFLLAICLGFAYMQWTEFRQPGTLGRGARMLAQSGPPAHTKETSLPESVLPEKRSEDRKL